MLNSCRSTSWAVLFLALLAPCLAMAESRTVVDFTGSVDLALIEQRDVELGWTESAGQRHLQIKSGHANKWPGITLKPASGMWDFSGFRSVVVDVTNTGKGQVRVGLRVDNPGADGATKCVQVTKPVAPGETQTLFANLASTPWSLSKPLDLVGMRGAPGAMNIDPRQVNQIIIFAATPEVDHQFAIGNIRLDGTLKELNADTFLPFIDEFGQYMHADWPGKIHSMQELIARREDEAQFLKSNPAVPGRSRFGGWADGPRLEATGFFCVAKHDGKWWLVDPEGYLFWSNGVTGVGTNASTPLDHREKYFKWLPGPDDALAAFYGKASWAPKGYYEGKTPYKTYNFLAANISRKYGENASERFADVAQLRLKSWGLNTIGNWSDAEIYRKGGTAYTANVWFSSRQIAGSSGYWGKFADVFDASFVEGLRKGIAQRKQEMSDPWCIGFFVDNELSWGTELSLPIAVLASPADQPAKRVFLADLKQRYTDIDRLNAAWGAAHASWDALAVSTDPPDEAKAREDLQAFSKKLAETYFRTIRDELRAAGMKQLYLGCRFAWTNEIAIAAASEYCDVVSMNRYAYDVKEQPLLVNGDKPLIIGEFHFGALDRGMFHPGLKPARDQAHRAELYTAYMHSALAEPAIVGAHWFQFASQATTGRGDGENYQIGFVDICDTPYAELVQAATELGQTMYKHRAKPAE